MTDILDNIGATLAARIAATRYEDLPEAVVRTTRLFILDTLGVIAGAARAPGMAELTRAVSDWESDGRATLLLTGAKAGPVSAAMANGAAAHSLDFDDQHDPARVHVFCVVLPAVLAAIEAEDRPVSGREMIRAVALGCEVFCRLGLTCYNSLGKGWHPTTALGTISAAAACGLIFRQEAQTLLDSMALAFVQLSGTTQFIADGALAKRLGPGFAARSGLQAAHLARHGITGPRRYLEGKAGLFSLYERNEVRPEILITELGEHWHLLDLSMKPYPCCRCTHTAIQLGLQLRAEGLRPEDLASAEIALGQVNHQIVGADFDRRHANPVVHAQFNAAYAFAAALRDGAVTIGSFTPDWIRAEDMAFAAQIRTVIDDKVPPTAIAPARIRVTRRDGTEVTVASPTMKGSPDDPMTEAEVEAKFRACLDWGFAAEPARVDALIAAIHGLAATTDARSLVTAFRLCAGD